MSENRSLFQKNDTGVSTKVDEFLKGMKAGPGGSGRLIFALDATANRKQAWDMASRLQGEMFREAAAIGGLSLQLIYYRGFGECQASPWGSESERLLRLMGRIDCLAGVTQISRVLSHAQKEAAKQPVAALVFIGDAMEENPDILVAKARELVRLGVRAFMFQEGTDSHVQRTFQDIARNTGGAFAKFGPGAARQLAELLQAVARYAAGGIGALGKDEASVLLLEQLRGGS
jgi:hypothetical protein